MTLDAYLARFFDSPVKDRKRHLDFFFDGWYRRTFSSLDAVIQLNERSDLVFGRTKGGSVETDYAAVPGLCEARSSSRSREERRRMRRPASRRSRPTVSGTSAGRRIRGGTSEEDRTFCGYRRRRVQGLLLQIGVVVGAGVLSLVRGGVRDRSDGAPHGLVEIPDLAEEKEFVQAVVDNALVDAFVQGVYIKSFADKAMGVAAKKLHGDPARLGPGQEPGRGQTWNTGDSTAMIGLLQAKVDLVKIIAGQIVRFDLVLRGTEKSGTEKGRPSGTEEMGESPRNGN
jgi:hypothetical protein